MKLLRVESNQKAVDFEGVMHAKIGILSALLISRHKGGDSVDDFLAHAAKDDADRSASSALDQVFAGALLCDDSTMTWLLETEKNRALLKTTLEVILETARNCAMGSKFVNSSVSKLSGDVKM